jgi:hypothetical protein
LAQAKSFLKTKLKLKKALVLKKDEKLFSRYHLRYLPNGKSLMLECGHKADTPLLDNGEGLRLRLASGVTGFQRAIPRRTSAYSSYRALTIPGSLQQRQYAYFSSSSLLLVINIRLIVSSLFKKRKCF